MCYGAARPGAPSTYTSYTSMTFAPTPLCLAALLAGLAAAAPARAQDTQDEDEVVVYGRSLDLVGEAVAASEGVVGYADFENRPFSRAGELVEVIPGAVATQHSGEGKANQYFLRGFNLDHGTDFSAHVNGVPVNLRTHGHGQGYLDLNFVIPELVERVDYRKGPYRASTGDFSAAGSARYTTRDTLETDFIEIGVGANDFLRGVAGVSGETGGTRYLLGAEAQRYDGPWVLEQDLEKYNLLAKLMRPVGAWEVEAGLSAYHSIWTSTDQVPARAVDSGRIDRFGFIDPDLGGDTTRVALNANAATSDADGADTALSAYVVSYDFSLFSNFTYRLEDPVLGDEFEQVDQRVVWGGAASHGRALSDTLRLRTGVEVRHDDIRDVGLFQTAGRARTGTVRRDAVRQTSLSGWAESELSLTRRLRATAGLRADYMEARVDARSEPRNGGRADDTLLSPGAGLAWEAAPGVELYANYGRGFHSNDARGATIRVEPGTGAPVDTVPLLVAAQGAELGARVSRNTVAASVAVFDLQLDSELVFVGDAGTTEPNSGSSRQGVEASLFWQPRPWLVLDVAGGYTDAVFDIAGPDTAIPGAVGTVVGGGAVLDLDPLTLAARLRHFGSAPLIEDGSVRSEPTTLVNLSGAYAWRDVTLTLELLNALDARDADISYFFESRLPGEAAGVEDIHFHPVEPRQLRASVRYRF